MTSARRHTQWKTTRSAGDGVSDEYEAVYQETLAADELAQMVYDRRTQLGLSQSQLAERAGMQQPAISRIEGGGTTPTVPLLKRLAKALDAELTIGFTPKQAPAPPADVDDTAVQAPQQAAQDDLDKLAYLSTPHILLVLEPTSRAVASSWWSEPADRRPGPMPHATPADVLKAVKAFAVEGGAARLKPNRTEAARWLALALSEELGLAHSKDWHHELPARLEGLLSANPPTP